MTTVPDTHAIDLQATSPAIAIGLDEVGVTGIVRGIQLGADGAATTARFDVASALGGDARGAHMSRFHEAIDHALALVGDEGRAVGSLAVLATVIATRAADLQGVNGSWARVEATIATPRTAPASSRRTIDPFDTWARVDVSRDASGVPATTLTIGVRASGMTACPCAQNLVRASARERLEADGIDAATIDHVLEALPVATHNQRSTGELELVIPGDGAVTEAVAPELLAALVRNSMSAQVHELLKRDDELAIVEAAHADPRFVEDCVRALLAAVAEDERVAAAVLPAATIVRVRQTNHESIHAHDVIAARSVTLGELRESLGHAPHPA